MHELPSSTTLRDASTKSTPELSNSKQQPPWRGRENFRHAVHELSPPAKKGRPQIHQTSPGKPLPQYPHYQCKRRACQRVLHQGNHYRRWRCRSPRTCPRRSSKLSRKGKLSCGSSAIIYIAADSIALLQRRFDRFITSITTKMAQRGNIREVLDKACKEEGCTRAAAQQSAQGLHDEAWILHHNR